MKKLLVIFLSFASAANLSAQFKYFIEFTDKAGTPYSVSLPQNFLSPRAIERRIKQNIPITEEDLPVTPGYIEQVQQNAAKIHYSLRWFNGVVATLTDQQVAAIQAFPFVKTITKIFEPVKSTSNYETDYSDYLKTESYQVNQLSYGASYTQIAMMNGHILHNNGYLGSGKVIAVLDAGFNSVDTHPAFDSLRQKGRILGTRDFVNPSSNIYAEHEHGMMVLSTMGGYVDGQLIGTAPRAEYWLIRTEDVNSEQIIEEYNWAAGTEFADSVGADIINSSLGYTTFDVTSQNHSYNDLNGNTAPSTRAANIAASKGIVVVVSAGNDGNSPWYYISVPADSPKVLTVGAVDSNKIKADFSSFGPTSDGRIKPDVCAMGKGPVLAIPPSGIGSSNGTSFSSPIMAGMVACLWQAKPTLTAQDLIDLVRNSSSNSKTPNNGIGYGIPDFALATALDSKHDAQWLNLWPNPFDSYIRIAIPNIKSEITTTKIYSATGQLLYNQQKQSNEFGIIEINLGNSFPKGFYTITAETPLILCIGKAIKK